MAGFQPPLWDKTPAVQSSAESGNNVAPYSRIVKNFYPQFHIPKTTTGRYDVAGE
jgi:hypothetical protein